MKIHFFTLLFSIVTFTTAYADHAHATIVFNAGRQSSTHGFKNNRSHSDYAYHPHCKTPSTSTPRFNTYTANDFKEYCHKQGYTENQLLNQRCLYMFDEFVKYAQTYSAYKCTIQQLYAELKKLNVIQKGWHTLKGTYCRGLEKRIHYLYTQLDTIKTLQQENDIPYISADEYKKYVQQITKNNHAVETFREQLPEYNTLDSPYSTHMPSLSSAIDRRLEAYNSMSTSDAAQYAKKTYNLNNNVKQLLHGYKHDTARFTECFGNKLDQAIHHESLDILDRVSYLSPNSLLYDHQEALVDFAVAIVDYNHEGLTDKAMNVADLCWTLLDYGQAVVEGAALGVYAAATDIVNNPIEATVCMIAGKQILVYQLSKVLYNVADIGVTAVTNLDHAKDKWNNYSEPLNNIINAISNKEITLRDTIKNGTSFTVGLIVQSKLLGGLSKFCDTIKQKSINFIHNNPLVKPQNYLTTPEGLLFKATSQTDKLKQSGQASAASNLKNSIEQLTGTIWNKIKPTDLMYPGTKIPKSFELTVGKQKFWVCPNATKHMLDYIKGQPGTHKKIATHNIPINSQSLLTSLEAAVEQAISKGITWKEAIVIDGWQLVFDKAKEGLLPVIYHANYKPKGF